MAQNGLRFCHMRLFPAHSSGLQTGRKSDEGKGGGSHTSIFYTPLYVAEAKVSLKRRAPSVTSNNMGRRQNDDIAFVKQSDIALVGSETSIYVEAQGAKDQSSTSRSDTDGRHISRVAEG